jgi:hypothetical protein
MANNGKQKKEAVITVTVEGESLVVSTPFCPNWKDSLAAMAQIPGRKYDGTRKVNAFPADQKAAVWAWLRSFYQGVKGRTVKGAEVSEWVCGAGSAAKPSTAAYVPAQPAPVAEKVSPPVVEGRTPVRFPRRKDFAPGTGNGGATSGPGLLSRVPRSDGEGYWEIRQAKDGSRWCGCPAWKFQHLPPRDRTCKHLQAYAREHGNA